MNNTLSLQILISFLAGGGFVTLLSLLAEKANENIAGIIMMFPSTVVVALFFLGITTSPEQVAAIVPALLIPLGVVIFSSVIYTSFALIISKLAIARLYQIGITFICSSLAWFVLVAPFAVWKINNLLISLTGYFLLITLAHLLLHRGTTSRTPAQITYTKSQILFRAIFIGTVIACVVYLGKTLDTFWGGIFAMYPAATLAAIMIFHWHYDPESLLHFFKKAPLGSLSICAYCLSVMIVFPKFGVAFGSALALAICAGFSLILIKVQKLRYRN